MRLFVCGALIALAGWHSLLAGPRGVVLMIADDLGRDYVGCYGNEVIKTPNLDRFAADSVRFQNAFATTASCSPSRSVIFTGLHVHVSGQYGLQHPPHSFQAQPGTQTIFSVLHRAGFRTGRIGKMHVGPDESYPIDFKISADARDVTRMAKGAEKFLKETEGSPFLLVIGFADPHRNFGNQKQYPDVTPIVYDPAKLSVPAHLPDLPEVRAELAEYYQSISRLDQGVGKVLDVIEKSGRRDDILVIFTSDNGMPFQGAKTTLYDAGIHLPLLIRASNKMRAGLVSQAMVSFIDLAPTVLDWCDEEISNISSTGRSLLPILDVEKPDGWDTVYASHSFHEITMHYPMRAIRTPQYKLIRNLTYRQPFPIASDMYNSATWQAVLNSNGVALGKRALKDFLFRPEYELYDLSADPHEVRNIADEGEGAKIIDGLKSQLEEFRKQTRDPWLELTDQRLPDVSATDH